MRLRTLVAALLSLLHADGRDMGALAGAGGDRQAGPTLHLQPRARVSKPTFNSNCFIELLTAGNAPSKVTKVLAWKQLISYVRAEDAIFRALLKDATKATPAHNRGAASSWSSCTESSRPSSAPNAVRSRSRVPAPPACAPCLPSPPAPRARPLSACPAAPPCPVCAARSRRH